MKRLFPLLFSFVLLGAITHSFFPTANDDEVLTSVNTPVDIDVLANDTETNAGATIFLEDELVLEPLHGTATVERNGTADVEDDFIRYVPDTNFSGVDSLIYEITNTFNADDEGTVRIFINEHPVANPDTFHVAPATATQLDVLANDTDADGDTLFIDSIFRVPLRGGAGIAGPDGAQVVVYTPNAGFVGRDSLQYVIEDGNAGRDTTWVQLVVNTPPVAVRDTVTTLPGTAVDIEVLDNDTDADGDDLTIAGIVDAPDRGTAQIIRNATEVRYTPTAGFSGTDSFQYAIVDPQGGGDTTTVIVRVNTLPVAVDDQATTVLETPVDIDVLDNDDDPDNDPLTVVSVEQPANGTASIISGGARVRYTPDDDFSGTDTFTYTVSDGQGGEDQATVTVEVLGNARVQFIHNALPTDPVDVYVDDTRVLDDFAFQTATPYMDIVGGAVTVDVTDGAAANNNDPFFSTTLTFTPTEAYVVLATGVAEQNFSLVVKDDARTTANPGFMDFFIAHGVLDAAASGIDIRELDPLNSNLPSQILADNLGYEALTDYISLAPGLYNLDATSFDGGTVYDAYQFNLGGLGGQTFTLVLSGLLNPVGDQPAFTLIGFDNQGDALVPSIVTAADDALELPTAFALRGNYPNPFNPATTLQFDLPAAAEVSVDVVDVLGRTVMTVPAKPFAAGANRRLEVDASRLASGIYLYRVLARTATETMVRTGRMTLVK